MSDFNGMASINKDVCSEALQNYLIIEKHYKDMYKQMWIDLIEQVPYVYCRSWKQCFLVKHKKEVTLENLYKLLIRPHYNNYDYRTCTDIINQYYNVELCTKLKQNLYYNMFYGDLFSTRNQTARFAEIKSLCCVSVDFIYLTPEQCKFIDAFKTINPEDHVGM